MQFDSELQYLILIVGLFLVPRVLQRFRLPSAITCVGLGAVLGMGFHLFGAETTVPTLATLGIVALFLFAGLEVDLEDLRINAKIVLAFLATQALLFAGGAVVARFALGLGWRPSVLVSLALFTSSTGFILDSLAGFNLEARQRHWVKTTAISVEIAALAALFFTIQSGTATTLGISSAALVAMVLILPLLFKLFATKVLPYAPKSEFAFLLILALVCAYVTRLLGVYYLVGAFVVGITAVRLREKLPALASERLLTAVELFASFFIPFYFFKAGLHLEPEQFTPKAIGLGLALTAVCVPLRLGIAAAFCRIAFGERLRNGARSALALTPTLVFSIVLAEILKERFGVPDYLYGAIIVYALVSTIVPGFLLHGAAPEFDTPHIPREPEAHTSILAETGEKDD